MDKDKPTTDDYVAERVPLTARSSFLSVALVRIGMTTALSQFMLGAMLGNSMTFGQAMLATLLGSLILEFVSLGLGLAGSHEGLSTSLLARWCGFGRFGSVLIGILLTISLVGWFGVQNAVFAHSLDYALGGRLGFTWSAVLAGGALTVLVAFGFRALSWAAKITVPLFFLVIGWISFGILQEHTLSHLVTRLPMGAPMTLGAGATIVAGGYMVGALITPDISRFCQNGRHVFWMTLISIIVGEFIVNGIAILVARALNTADVVTIMTQSAGWIGLLTVILATTKNNDACLYSSSLSLANVVEGVTCRKLSRTKLTIILGVIGTLLSMLGILERFTGFLILLGVVFPPIAGVMLVDYYILRTSRHLLDVTRQRQTLPESTQLMGWPAVAACILGAIGGMTIELGIPSFNSLIIACVVYGILVKVSALLKK
ncbi:cytosine permease [Candidatus Fukatsuia endosymbiont of Tuberolachnus salignus]|uniref:cytosine permease n=1 Tax=Candidatus Fukatsuia endosymbiont of Tuberolachnus salignus TaxID=3077957 RepID=UPI00313B288A